MEITIYPFRQELARLLAGLREAEWDVAMPAEPTPATPYLQVLPGGWELVGLEHRPRIVVNLVLDHDPQRWLLAHAGNQEAVLYSLLRHLGLISLGPTSPAQVEEVTVGNRSVRLVVAQSTWRFP